MDPNAVWQALIEALPVLAQNPHDAGLRATIVDLLQILAHWIRRGGFPPTIQP